MKSNESKSSIIWKVKKESKKFLKIRKLRNFDKLGNTKKYQELFKKKTQIWKMQTIKEIGKTKKFGNWKKKISPRIRKIKKRKI